MELTVIDGGTDALRLRLKGRLDASGAEAVESAFTSQVSSAGRNVLVDLAEVSFTGSLGIRMLISAARVATIQAARELYPTNAAVEAAITQAWTAVGVN